MRRLVSLAAVLVAGTLAWTSQATGPGFEPQIQTRRLFAHDFLRHTVSLRTGRYGTVVQDYQVFNRDSELDYGGLYDGMMIAGVQGGQSGEILPLGTSRELADRYGYSETVGGGQGFASIHYRDGELVILDDRSSQTYQPFTEGNDFFNATPPQDSEPVTPEVGHLYLIRIHDRHDPRFYRFVKLMVVSRVGNRELAIVWQELLPDRALRPFGDR